MFGDDLNSTEATAARRHENVAGALQKTGFAKTDGSGGSSLSFLRRTNFRRQYRVCLVRWPEKFAGRRRSPGRNYIFGQIHPAFDGATPAPALAGASRHRLDSSRRHIVAALGVYVRESGFRSRSIRTTSGTSIRDWRANHN